MIWPLLRGLGRNLGNFFVGIFVQAIISLGHSEIVWPLQQSGSNIFDNSRLKVPEGRPPWADAFTSGGNFGTSSQMLVDMWEGNEKFRQQVLNELIKDCIHVEVAGIASATLAVNIY